MPKPERRSGRFDIGNQSGNNISNVGRDQYNYRNSYHSDNPYAGLGGVGKFLVGVGMLLAFIGFALFAFPIVSALASPGFVQPDTSSFPLAFGLMLVGIFISGISTLIFGGRNGGNR